MATMADIQEVDPSTIRFTQRDIGLYFKEPYEGLSVRDAVQKISKGEMRADQFKRIRVCLHDGVMFSVDNRRLWVFRWSKCEKIEVRVLKEQHSRFKSILASPTLSFYKKVKSQSFFPRVRGDPDVGFESLFPKPGPVAKSRSKSKKWTTKKWSKKVPAQDGKIVTDNRKGVPKNEAPAIQGQAGATVYKRNQGEKENVGVHEIFYIKHRGANSVGSWKEKETGRGRHEEEIVDMGEGKETARETVTGSTEITITGLGRENAKTKVFHADTEMWNVNEEIEAVSPLVALWRIVTGAMETMITACDTFCSR